jgi:hypothetical protein
MWAEGAALQGCYLAPDPKAVRDKLREPRSGDFSARSPGVQGAAAIGRPLRAPCACTIYMAWSQTGAQREDALKSESALN